MAFPRLDGRSTEPELIALRAAFGIPAEGTRLSYQMVAAVIKCAPESTRFRTVTVRWRRWLLREHNTLINARDQAFVAEAPSGFVQQVSTHTEKARRQVRRALVVGAKTDRRRLSEAERGQLDHNTLKGARWEEYERAERRRQLPPTVNPVSAQDAR